MLNTKTINQNIKSFYIGVMITSVVGGILLLFTDFAGWHNYSYYVNSWGWVGPNLDNPITIIPFLILAGCLFYGACVSLLGLLDQPVSFKLINSAFLLSVFVLAVVIIGALIFVLEEISTDDWWWFEAGFYGGFIGSLLSSIFFYLIRKVSAE